jgi:hypothetical protein
VWLQRFERYGSLIVAFTNEPAFAVGPAVVESGLDVALSDVWAFRAQDPNCLPLNKPTRARSYTFDADFVPDDLVLLYEDPQGEMQIQLNGSVLGGGSPWAKDSGYRCCRISAHTQAGANELIVSPKGRSRAGDVRPRVMGSFSLSQDLRILPQRVNLRDGSWTTQGYPFYSGTGVYSQPVNIPDFLRSQRVVLRVPDPGDCVAFVVNGALTGVRAWAPFETDITPLVKPGNNLLELHVTNGLTNSVWYDPRPSGLIHGATVTIR